MLKRAYDEYIKDVIKHIEAPLYIYSGKLLQTHQNGSGVFCTTGLNDKVSQFKLTTNGDERGHDVLLKFISGQRMIINVALILALRKIKQLNLDLVLIDDPCQSMDEMSMLQ